MTPISRSIGQYRPWAALLAALAGSCAILAAMASPGGASPRAEAPPDAEPKRIGMNSCAARGCHGAVDKVDPSRGDVYIKGGAYTTWLNFDPHASAYDVLLESRSVGIAEKLKGPLGGKPAHEAALCLSCHATVPPPEAIRPDVAHVKDGITCESCHGPAEVWQDKHLDAAWRAKPATAKAIDGMTDLGTPTARARKCVGCHVGDRSRGMDMNHDLIAAGHPRLNFEFGSYLATYPKHWKEKPDTAGDFEARSWAIGQVVTAQAVLELLAARAAGSKDGASKVGPSPDAIWPEFSEYECFACHHGLASPSPLQTSAHIQLRPGRLPWSTWHSSMLPDLAEGQKGINLNATGSPWARLQVEMGRAVPDADRVAELASASVRQLEVLLGALERAPLPPDRVASLMKDLAARPSAAVESWDRAAQQSLALSSLVRAARDLKLPVSPEIEESLRAASRVLEFPPKYDSPRKAPASSSPTPAPKR
jgi:Cytochrome c554 and c-prime